MERKKAKGQGRKPKEGLRERAVRGKAHVGSRTLTVGEAKALGVKGEWEAETFTVDYKKPENWEVGEVKDICGVAMVRKPDQVFVAEADAASFPMGEMVMENAVMVVQDEDGKLTESANVMEEWLAGGERGEEIEEQPVRETEYVADPEICQEESLKPRVKPDAWRKGNKC